MMIKWFRDISENDFKIVGGKGYNLSKMFNHGIAVPNGFVVTTEAYDTYVKDNHLKIRIEQILSTQKSTTEKSKDIKLLFNIDTFHEDLKQQILLQMDKMASDRVAVRSSSTAEDLPGMSFAGKYSSFLNVKKC